MNILDRFTSIDDLLVTLLERIGGVTEEDTHFFSYPNDGTRATIVKGTTTLDFMSGTVMTPAGVVSSLGNSLRARGREYCRSLSLQADRDIIIQIGTKSKIPVFAGTWFKVAHLRFTDVKIIAAEDTRTFVIACTNPDSIEMAGETYVKDPVDVWGNTTTIGNAELAVRTHAPPITFDRQGDVLRWADFESATPNYILYPSAASTLTRSTDAAKTGSFSMKYDVCNNGYPNMRIVTNDFHIGRIGGSCAFSSATTSLKIDMKLRYHDGVNMGKAEVRYDTGTQILSYMADGGGYVSLGTLPYNHVITNFSTMKIVADFEKSEYVRLVFFGSEFDLSGITLDSEASALARSLTLEMRIWSEGAGVGVAYVDNMILTGNEPIKAVIQ